MELVGQRSGNQNIINMKKRLLNPFQDILYTVGLSLLITSFSIMVHITYASRTQDPIILFFVAHLLTVGYSIAMMVYNRKVHGGVFRFKTRRYNILTLLLWTSSAYILNVTMTVFAESVPWLSAWILTYSVALLFISLLKKLGSHWVDYILVSILSLATIFHFYQTLMTFTLYPITIASFWLFGISLHALVPIFSFFLCLRILRSYLDLSKYFLRSIQICTIMLGTIIFLFVYKWNAVVHKIGDGYTRIEEPYAGNDLPAWCTIGQTLPDDDISKRLLGGGEIFVTQDDVLKWDRLGMPSSKMHDPLVLIASLLIGHLDVDVKDRRRISEVIYNKRHEAEWKLWRDDDLITNKIETKVQLFPAERMAYTEKTIDIHNKNQYNWNQQEALYTFYLPEGSVVTSASLWINGKEEQSYLTTKTKADSAYKRIVGVENRDPLLVHWQEGNRVTARIFPVTKNEPRTFKLGITTPLEFEDGSLKYTNIDFKGPSVMTTTEKIELMIEGKDRVKLDTPLEFAWDLNKYNYYGLYYSDWALKIEAPPLNEGSFNFNNKSYKLSNLEYFEKPISEFKKVYLDVNKSWSKQEFYDVFSSCEGMQIYMLDGESIVHLNEANAKQHFKMARKNNFSVFPIYKISEPNASLLISKNNHITPVIDDFEGTPFGEKLSSYMSLSAGELVLFDIGTETSQFFNSLIELKSIICSGSDLDSFLETGKISIPKTMDNGIVLDASRTVIEIGIGNEELKIAPDHLMRMYSYNSLMKKVGKEFSGRKSIEDTYIVVAEEAHILSPISSMIVLESQADYDRFDIKRSKNSLGNASFDQSGSVPEPHEWMLIVILICSLLYLHFKSRSFS